MKQKPLKLSFVIHKTNLRINLQWIQKGVKKKPYKMSKNENLKTKKCEKII
jgi:hypothetical protein